MYKSVVLFCALLSIGFCKELDKNWLQQRSLLIDVFAATTCLKQFSCLDCKTARICKPDGKGAFQQVATIPCPAATPYCNANSGTCSKIPDDTCGAADASFICLDDGYFPDSVCTVYHVCKDFTAFKYQCAVKGETYDAEKETCSIGAPCGTFECPAAGIKTKHTIYPQFFGYCNAPKAAPVVVDKCKGSYEMNKVSQVCEPPCTEEGVQEDVEDCTKYYKCHNVKVQDATKEDSWISVMVRDHMDCPKNTSFDPDQYMCVDINETSCKPKK